MKTAKNIFGGKNQNTTNGLTKMNTVVNTPTGKDTLEQKTEREPQTSPPQTSPPEYATPRNNLVLDKNNKNKISMINFGKGKFGTKHQRNSCLKPPKKSYTVNSNRNSSSDSSFTSFGQLGLKPAFQEAFTPNAMTRGSFEVRSSADFINNTAQNMSKKYESPIDGFNPVFNATVDVRDGKMNDLCAKGK